MRSRGSGDRSTAIADISTATRRPRRYIVVGLVCAGMHNLLMLASDAAGIHYMIALAVSFVVLVPTAYALHSRYTFERDVAPIRFVRFAGGLIVAFPINFVLMVAMVSGLSLSVPVATLLSTAMLFAWNYMTARWAILLHREQGSQPG